MELLAAIPSGLSKQVGAQFVASVRKQRDQEIASGVRSLEPAALQPARVSRKRTQSVAEPSARAPVLEALLDGEHARFLKNALAHEALRCFNLTGPHTQYRLLHDHNINAFPGFRNFGNTCWLNTLLQAVMHTVPLRKRVLQESVVESALDRALRRICRSYWAMPGCQKHSVIAPN